MSLLRVVPLCVALLCSGCVTQQVEPISGAQFVDYGSTPLSHTLYLGSDGAYHYFAWSYGKAGGRWKIHKEEFIITNEFAVGDREAFLSKDKDGRWCAFPCE